MPLRHLFVDMNSYFASVEQQERPELRGQPVGVVQMRTDTTCCIAASYEAKSHGVKTGTMVPEARRLCPGMRFVEARHEKYVQYHHKIVKAVESCLPIEQVHSVDEMSCRLMGQEREIHSAVALARAVKAAITRDVGRFVRCSVGIAPNAWLAKVASDMQKPDGLTVIRSEDLPHALHSLKLTDLPGIAHRMERRLLAFGVRTVEELCALKREQMERAWESRVIGGLWYRRLHGEDLAPDRTLRRTVGHSRVLPPEQRTDEASRRVLVCMTHKAAERLRKLNHWAGSVSVTASFSGGGRWSDHGHVEPCRDTPTILSAALKMWDGRPPGKPMRVAVCLFDLAPAPSVTLPLFEPMRRRERLSNAMDRLNARYGSGTLYFAAMHGAKHTVPVRIPFTKIPDVPKAERTVLRSEQQLRNRNAAWKRKGLDRNSTRGNTGGSPA